MNATLFISLHFLDFCLLIRNTFAILSPKKLIRRPQPEAGGTLDKKQTPGVGSGKASLLGAWPLHLAFVSRDFRSGQLSKLFVEECHDHAPARSYIECTMHLDSALVVIQNIQLLRNFRKSERLLRIQKSTFCGSDVGTRPLQLKNPKTLTWTFRSTRAWDRSPSTIFPIYRDLCISREAPETVPPSLPNVVVGLGQPRSPRPSWRMEKAAGRQAQTPSGRTEVPPGQTGDSSL